ncbi:protein kinase domain-containing protein [Streptomyces zingiberis]|uniref:non-specific serine/threonine protein kinase n=1 Tax=Streptomyces zingiberis TaxID=2053010 RepID=A0ABX1BS65_9ACTN|nr:protein kinase [Streptomyces zingiberis]NJP99292.1 serine/threonine protein kinase [Streptomyces zingiberis]
MSQTHGAGGPSASDPARGDRVTGPSADSPEFWGDGGLVGDGRYRLTHRLGRGGMAEVFAAEDVRLGRTVAVKLLRSDLAEDPVSKARFTREAQSVAGLNHHAVVAVYDSGEDVVGGSTVPYIVMELVEGSTIRDLLGADAPPPDQALIIVSGVLEALAYSHHHGIVHRDIKPANVIITNGGAVKVMDFGIARALHGAQSTMTQTGMVMGTPQYLSPEQALGKTVDTRSDLYATGCLLYELLAHRPPFTGESPLSVVYQHVQDMPVPPSQVSPSAPPELDGLVMRSLAKDPDDRFQTAEEMRGLAQYALQMLAERGSHTGGVWDTGPVDAAAGTAPTAAMGGTAMMPAGGGDTSQIPAPLLGAPRRDDGGFDGYRRDGGRDGRGGGGGGRGTMMVLAALAAIAVVVGVVYALGNGDDGGDQKSPRPSPTASKDAGEKGSPSPEEDTSEDPGTAPEPGGENDGWNRPEQPGNQDTPPRTDPTSQPPPSSDPPTQPTSAPPPSQTTGGDNGGGEPDPGGEDPPGDAGGGNGGTPGGASGGEENEG